MKRAPSVVRDHARRRGIARHAVASLAGLALAGCSVVQRVDEMFARHEAAGEDLQARHQAFARGIADPHARRAAQQVDRAWLAGPIQPLARDALLPPALQAHVNTTLLFSDGQVVLPVLADRIARATGVPVRVLPEALLPAEDFMSRLADGTRQPVVALPTTATFGDGPQPLPSVLDRLAVRLGVHWRYRNGVIEFYRVETRIFDLRLLTMQASAEARLGRSGSETPGGFESTSSTALTLAEHDAVQAVIGRIEALLSRAGTVAAQSGAGSSVVVTDTPDALARIADFLARENRTLTRRVRLVFEEITLAMDRQNEGGIDWRVVHQSTRAASALSGAVPDAITDGARLGSAILDGPMRSSEAIIAALSRFGTVLRHTRVPVYTLNRRPVTHAVRTTFSYIDQAQTTASLALGETGLGAALPSVSVTQKQETTGTFLTLLPDAQEDGQVLLSVSYDNTVAQPLDTITFGADENQVQIQQLTIDGSGTVQQVALRPGHSLIIAGFDRSEDDASRRRPLDGLPLLAGGQDRAGSQRTTTLVMVGVELEEGF